MFGMGFFEIFLVLIVAIIALGPEKLPTAAVEVVKFFKKFKSGIEDAKSTINNELQLEDMKREAQQFQSSLTEIKSNVEDVTSSVDLDIDEITSMETKPSKKKDEEPAKEIKAEKKSSKKEKISFDNEDKA
jgi:sec-independent protein translocase protein TatB